MFTFVLMLAIELVRRYGPPMAASTASSEFMRGTRVRFYPRRRQREYLTHAFGVGRFVWNWGLATKRDAYQKGGITVSFAELSRRLTALRSEKTWLTVTGAWPAY